MSIEENRKRLLPDEWLLKESGVGAAKCPLCEVIHSANCPKFVWVAGLLEAYAVHCCADLETALRNVLEELKKYELHDLIQCPHRTPSFLVERVSEAHNLLYELGVPKTPKNNVG